MKRPVPRSATQSAERLTKLLEAVIAAPQRPIGPLQLRELTKILVLIKEGFDVRQSYGIRPAKLRSRGRPRADHEWLVVHFLVHKESRPNVRDKALYHDITQAWATTPAHVKKLVATHRNAALALMKKDQEGARAFARAMQRRVPKID